MMSAKEKLQRNSVALAFDGIYKYIKKEPQKNLVKLINAAQKLMGGTFPEKNYDKFREAVTDPDNVWGNFAMRIINETDGEYAKKMLLALGLGAGLNGTKAVRANREKYKCNIPFIILLDPTSACNKKCKGCWSAEYGYKSNLTLDELRSIVNQGTEMGTHLYMFTGGEPLIRKDDIFTLCRENPDCAFLAYTNATLVDEAFCDTMKEIGNLTLAISLEGLEEENDSRRGEGSFEKSVAAMEMLQKKQILYGISVCYTSRNIESATSDKFMDFIIDKGARFALYFNYMPIGSDADPSLIPTPEQRVKQYHWLRKVRDSKQGKPIFVMDFQNDGEYVGGCIAGGRNYFHINSEGDIEPCVFIHYSDSNIRQHTLLEALKRPLFRAYWHNQPFNDNHLRPCPLLENPERLREIIAKTQAKSTDLVTPEDVETVCSRCDKYAAAWKPVAEELWNSRSHPNPKTQFYRDTEEGKAEIGKNNQ